MSDIKWTKARRKKLHGFRTPTKHDPADAVLSKEDSWAILRALPLLRTVGEAPAEVKAMLSTRTNDSPPDELDVKAEAARTDLVFRSKDPMKTWEEWAEARALVGLWLGVEGFRFAIDVLRQAPPFEFDLERRGDDVVMDLKPATHEDGDVEATWGAFRLNAIREPLFWALRNHVAHMDEAALGAATKSVADLEGVPEGENHLGTWWHRGALVYALSRDESLVNAQVDALLRAETPDKIWEGVELLAVATTDVARATELGKRARFGQYSLDLLATHGEDAGPILQESFERARQYSALQYLKHERAALKMLGIKV